MKKQFLKLGKVLSRLEQKEIFGGRDFITYEGDPCQVNTEPGNLPGGCTCTDNLDCSSNTCIDGKCF